MENNYTVYLHKNIVNGKCYVGITKLTPYQRWRKNGRGYKPSKGRNESYFYKAIKKYGWDNFTHHILETGLSKEQAELKEQYYIFMWQTQDRDKGYNIAKGGEGCNDWREGKSEEELRLYREHQAKRTIEVHNNRSDEENQIIQEKKRKSMQKHYEDKSNRDKQSKAMTKRWDNKTERERQSNTMKEMFKNEEIKKRQSDGLKKHHKNMTVEQKEAWRKKLSDSKKEKGRITIICDELNLTFCGYKAVLEYCDNHGISNVTMKTLCSCLNGKKRTCGEIFKDNKIVKLTWRKGV